MPEREMTRDELVTEIERLRTALERIVYTEDINPAAYKIAREALRPRGGHNDELTRPT